MFPAGVLFDKENDSYRTENENEVFKLFRRISTSYEEEKNKSDNRNYSIVALCRKEAIFLSFPCHCLNS